MATQMQFWEVFLSLSSVDRVSLSILCWNTSTVVRLQLESALSALLECRMQFHFVEDTCWPCCMHCTYLCTKLQDNCDTLLRRMRHTLDSIALTLSQNIYVAGKTTIFSSFFFPFPHFFDFSLSLSRSSLSWDCDGRATRRWFRSSVWFLIQSEFPLAPRAPL